MGRMHIGLQVNDLEESVEFYTRLFGAAPTLRRPDYAGSPRFVGGLLHRGRSRLRLRNHQRARLGLTVPLKRAALIGRFVRGVWFCFLRDLLGLI